MLSKQCTTLILLAGLVAITAHGSAIKGHHHQAAQQPVQRAEEQARLAAGSLKSPAAFQPERSPKSAPAQAATPILESSKKVYNDVSFRRSVSQSPSQQQQQQYAEPAAKSSPAVVEQQAPAAPAEQQPASSAQSAPAKEAGPAPAAAAVASPAAQEQPKVAAAQPVPAPVQAAVAAAAPVESVAKPAEPSSSAAAAAPAKPSDELPVQSDRSAPIKDELKPPVVVASQSSPVVVEQVVPAKVPASVVEPAAQQAPAESKSPVVAAEPQVQPAAPVVVSNVAVAAAAQAQASQPEPVVEPMKPMTMAAAAESGLQAKKDEPSAAKSESHEPIEVPAPDPGLVLSEPIDSTTKLLIDLDEHVQKFLPAEDKQEPGQPPKEAVLVSGVDYSPAAQAHASPASASESQPISGKSNVPLMPYSSNSAENEPIVPPLPASLDKVEKAAGAQAGVPSAVASAATGSQQQPGSATRQAGNHQHQNQQQVITQLLDQLDSLQNRIQDTINQLVARRRYVMSALLRPMGTYVRRVRTNLERLQNRVNQLQAAASSVGGGGNNQNQRPGGFVDAAAIETIRRRIDDISKRISDIVNRIRFSLTPTSAPLNNNGRK